MEDGEEEEETMVPKRKTEREIELEEGDDYIIDLKKKLKSYRSNAMKYNNVVVLQKYRLFVGKINI